MKRINKIATIIIFLFAATNASAQKIEKWKLADLEKAISKSNQPTIFNFWATFCVPCLEEIPYFQQTVKENKNVQLILVNLDAASVYPKLAAFAKKRGITAKIVFLDETNADLFCPAVDEKWSGAIPASLFLNNKTGYRKFFEDKIKKEDFRKEVLKLTE